MPSTSTHRRTSEADRSGATKPYHTSRVSTMYLSMFPALGGADCQNLADLPPRPCAWPTGRRCSLSLAHSTIRFLRSLFCHICPALFAVSSFSSHPLFLPLVVNRSVHREPCFCNLVSTWTRQTRPIPQSEPVPPPYFGFTPTLMPLSPILLSSLPPTPTTTFQSDGFTSRGKSG